MTPRLTIITPSFQQAQYLEQTIDSVLSQNYPNLEYIVIDGGSTDGSVDVIKKYEKHLAYWVSEKDRGQAHALNKGFSRATGDIHAYINSDDYYAPSTFARAIDLLCANPPTSSFANASRLLIGNVINFGSGETTTTRYSVPSKNEQLHWLSENPIHQPGTFWTADLMRLFGPFDESLHYTFDFDFFLKCRFLGQVLPIGVDETFAHFRCHPSSKTMSSWPKFEREFDVVRSRIVRKCPEYRRYWSRLHAARLQVDCLRRSEAGEKREAWNNLIQSIRAYPGIAVQRRTAGCIRRLLLGFAQ